MDTFDWAIEAYASGAIFVSFDLETTGLDPKKDRIAEIGAVKFDNKGLIARFSALVNPGIPMPAEAGRVNNISDEMLAGKPGIDKVLPDFLGFINKTIIVAYNAPFDCGFVNECLKSRWEEGESSFFSEKAPGSSPFPSLPNPIADALVFARGRFTGRKSYSLQNMAADLGIPALEAHRAEDDARLCMEIFIQALSQNLSV